MTFLRWLPGSADGWCQTRWFALRSSRKKAGVSGEIQLAFALVDSSNEAATATEVYEKWSVWQSAFVQSPTPNSGDDDPLSRDLAGCDGLSDDDDEGESSPSPDEGVAATAAQAAQAKSQKKAKGRKKSKRDKLENAYQLTGDSDVVGVIFLEI